jgi:predicted LPLAT superfamily acyltransferase
VQLYLEKGLMSEWSGQTKGNLLGYRIFIFILRHLNIRVSYFAVWFVALYFYLFTNKKAIRNFYLVTKQYKNLKLEITIFQNFFTFGKILLDRVSLLAGFSSKFTFEFEGEEHLRKMASSGKGGIIIGAHAGNWEVAGKLLNRLNCNIHIVMYDGEHSNIKDLFEKISGGKSLNIIAIKPNDLSHIYKINEALQKGDLIAMHGDRFVQGSKSLDCMFFEKKAAFPLGPYYLAATAKVPVCFVSTMKESASHYHFYSTKPLNVVTENISRREKEESIKNLASLYAANLEKIVAKYPLQWFNYYAFWGKNNSTN